MLNMIKSLPKKNYVGCTNWKGEFRFSLFRANHPGIQYLSRSTGATEITIPSPQGTYAPVSTVGFALLGLEGAFGLFVWRESDFVLGSPRAPFAAKID